MWKIFGAAIYTCISHFYSTFKYSLYSEFLEIKAKPPGKEIQE